MAITKKAGRQEIITAIVDVDATSFDTSIIGTASTSLLEVIELPEKAIILGGTLSVPTAFNTEGVSAYGVLTSTAAPADTNTVTIGTQVYTFKAALTASTTANEVLIGISEATSLANLAAAINGTGTPGTDYGSLTVPRTDVVATTDGVHTLTITAVRGSYTTLNTLATTETHANATWGGATLVDYVVAADTIAVKIGSDTYLTASGVDAVNTGYYSLVPTGTALTSVDTVDLVWDVANTTTLAPTTGTVRLIVKYIINGREEFTQG